MEGNEPGIEVDVLGGTTAPSLFPDPWNDCGFLVTTANSSSIFCTTLISTAFPSGTLKSAGGTRLSLNF